MNFVFCYYREIVFEWFVNSVNKVRYVFNWLFFVCNIDVVLLF